MLIPCNLGKFVFQIICSRTFNMSSRYKIVKLAIPHDIPLISLNSI